MFAVPTSSVQQFHSYLFILLQYHPVSVCRIARSDRERKKKKEKLANMLKQKAYIKRDL